MFNKKPRSSDREKKERNEDKFRPKHGKPFPKRGDDDKKSDRGERKFFKKDDNRGKDKFPKKRFGGDKKFDAPFKRKPFADEEGIEKAPKKDDRNFSRPYKAKPYFKKNEDGFGEKKFYKKKGPSTPQQPTRDDGKVRLNKFIANAGVCSRREADDLITSGVISVNGKNITELGFRVSPDDDVRMDGKPLRMEKMVYILLNKPKDYITTSDDPQGRRTVLSLIQGACRERVYPVGRLDRNTTGLLLMTNDGELAKNLTHPRYGIKKIYQVTLDKNLKQHHLEQITEGIKLEDGLIKPDAISYVGDGSKKSEIGIELHSGRNRIVRRLFEHLEYRVEKLDRVYFAGLTKKDLPKGRWRFLNDKEVAMLKMVSH